MARLLPLLFGALLLAGCGFGIPNGVFSCVSGSDCPTGFFCWNSDSRCYDSKEPPRVCEPATCEDVVAQFTALGVTVECGTLPDGCDGVVECPSCVAGESCGANGQTFQCGCEPNTCSSVGAECGVVRAGCATDDVIDCGQCPSELQQCEDNRCACPEGQDCSEPCGTGRCSPGQVCVEGECCTPSFPCAENQCSPPGGLPNGCGELVECPRCGLEEDCQLDPSTQRFECQNDCTCKAQGIECGTAAICGTSQLCGLCDDPNAPLCDDGKCVCEDRYEHNDDPTTAALIDCGGACALENLKVELEGTIDGKGDYDFYRIEVAHHQDYAPRIDVSGLQSTRQVLLTYVCPGGSERIAYCSGSSSSFGSSKYCIEDGSDTLRLVQECGGSNGASATVIVGVSAKDGEFSGPCDTYSLTVSSDYYEYDD